jgi:hypothetical protein
LLEQAKSKAMAVWFTTAAVVLALPASALAAGAAKTSTAGGCGASNPYAVSANGSAPGAAALITLSGDAKEYATIGAIIAFFACLAIMLGAKAIHHPQGEQAAKISMIVAVFAAFLVNFGPTLLNTAANIGSSSC